MIVFYLHVSCVEESVEVCLQNVLVPFLFEFHEFLVSEHSFVGDMS